MLTSFFGYLQKKTGVDIPYFAHGGFWLLLAQGVTLIGSFAVTVILANTLDEHDFGVYRYIISIGILLTAISLTGLDVAVLQAASKKYISFFSEAIKISLIYSIGIVAASFIGTVYYLLQGNTTLAIGCVIIAIFQPLANTFQNIFPFLQGQRRFKESTISQAIKTIVVSSASIGAVLLTKNVLVLILVFFITQTITNTVAYLLYRPQSSQTTEPSIFNKYIRYAKHTSVRNIIANIAFRLDTVLVFQQLGAAELAVYTVATTLPEQIKGVFKNFGTLLLPKYAQHESIESVRANIMSRSVQIFILSLFVTTLYIVIAPYFYSIFFPKYTTAIFYSQVLALSFPAMVAVIPLSALQSQLKEKELHYLNITQAFISIILTLFMIYVYGLIGAIFAKVISRYISQILTYYFVFRA